MISGLFSTILGICSGWFLYIFIDPSADLGKAIMNKRAKQITMLQKIDKYNTYYNYNQLVQIVYDGIVKRYKMKPNEVLDLIYKKSIAVSGIAGLADLEIETIPDEQEIQKLSTYKDTSGNTFDSKSNKMVKDANGNIIPQNRNLWKDLGSVIEWLVNLLKSIGVNFGSSSYTPAPGDWYGYDNNNKSEASIAGALPLVVGGVIIYYLFTATGKKGKSKN